MSIAISYSCSAGTATGRGFSASDQPSGAGSATIARPPAGTNTATYGLTCESNGKKSEAQCSVQIGIPSIILVANPKSVKSGETSLVGWVTSGMDSCIISSSDDANFTAQNAGNTSPNGAATTLPITKSTSFTLKCQTLAGGTKETATTVTLQ